MVKRRKANKRSILTVYQPSPLSESPQQKDAAPPPSTCVMVIPTGDHQGIKEKDVKNPPDLPVQIMGKGGNMVLVRNRN